MGSIYTVCPKCGGEAHIVERCLGRCPNCGQPLGPEWSDSRYRVKENARFFVRKMQQVCANAFDIRLTRDDEFYITIKGTDRERVENLIDFYLGKRGYAIWWDNHDGTYSANVAGLEGDEEFDGYTLKTIETIRRG